MRFAFGLPVAIGLFGAIAGCSGFDKKEAKTDRVFRYPVNQALDSLDPAVAKTGDSVEALQQVFESLLTWNEKSEIAPQLAESWTPELGGKAFVFKIKKGVKFHNGRELVAEDFVYSLNRVCRINVASGYVHDVLGAKEVMKKTATEVAGIKALDSHTLRIEFTAARPYSLHKLTDLGFAPVAKEALADGGEMKSVDQMIGTGPYRAMRHEPGQLLTLSAFDEYHGGRPKVDRMERRIVLDSATRLNLYKSGELDLLPIQRNDVAGVKGDPVLAGQLRLIDRPSVYFLGLNCAGKYPPFKDRRVRQAVAMSIDRAVIVETYLNGTNRRASGMIPPGIPGHRGAANGELAFNPAKARALLLEAGLNAAKMPVLELFHRAEQTDVVKVAEAISSQIETNLGLKVSLRSMPQKQLIDRYKAGDLPFFHGRWFGDIADPQNFISHHHTSDAPENHFGYKNAEVDKLCRQADTSFDQTLRISLYQKAEDLILQDAVWIPIYFQRDAELRNPKLSGLKETLFGHLSHSKAELR